ncbi:MAG: hypothetical protein ACXWWG_00590 [Nitrospira sp.]
MRTLAEIREAVDAVPAGADFYVNRNEYLVIRSASLIDVVHLPGGGTMETLWGRVLEVKRG